MAGNIQRIHKFISVHSALPFYLWTYFITPLFQIDYTVYIHLRIQHYLHYFSLPWYTPSVTSQENSLAKFYEVDQCMLNFLYACVSPNTACSFI